jgi:RNA polymerase-binding transcription factor DksA
MTQSTTADITAASSAAGPAGRLAEMLTRCEQQLHRLATTAPDRGEEESTRALVDAIRSDMVRIRRALHRLDTGTYGRCLGCGTTIPPERLDAMPEVERCTRCA